MIPLLSREQCRAIDELASSYFGISSAILMENAGVRAADEIARRFSTSLERVVVVCGTGQNGGDGFVVARQLHARAVPCVVVLVGDPATISRDALSNFQRLTKLGVSVEHVAAGDDALSIESASLLVDAIFGTGLNREVDGIAAQILKRMEVAAAKIVALDVPSGVDANTGAVLGVAAHAALTITFAAHKQGLSQYPARAFAGEVVLASIGAPSLTAPNAFLVEAVDLAESITARAADAYKGTAGHVIVVAGSPGKSGAALLAGRAALRAGAGLVTLIARDEQTRSELVGHMPELMVEHVDIRSNKNATAQILAIAERLRAKSMVIGPGFGTDEDARRVLKELSVDATLPCVLDADALTAIAENLESLREAKGSRVLTPHPGEGARLLACSIADVQRDRFAAASEIAKATQQLAVLKGAGTVIGTPAGRSFVIGWGTPALGTAGTGDVLAGALGAWLAQGQASLAAAIVAASTHAMAGELAASADRGLLAHEVADALPRALAAFQAQIGNKNAIP